MLFTVVPFTALGGVPEPYGPAPTWGGVAPGGYSRGPETYWKGAYWQPEEPSPYTNPGGCADPENMSGCFSDSFQPWRKGWNSAHVYHNK